jgi:hypothetical protein
MFGVKMKLEAPNAKDRLREPMESRHKENLAVWLAQVTGSTPKEILNTMVSVFGVDENM